MMYTVQILPRDECDNVDTGQPERGLESESESESDPDEVEIGSDVETVERCEESSHKNKRLRVWRYLCA